MLKAYTMPREKREVIQVARSAHQAFIMPTQTSRLKANPGASRKPTPHPSRSTTQTIPPQASQASPPESPLPRQSGREARSAGKSFSTVLGTILSDELASGVGELAPIAKAVRAGDAFAAIKAIYGLIGVRRYSPPPPSPGVNAKISSDIPNGVITIRKAVETLRGAFETLIATLPPDLQSLATTARDSSVAYLISFKLTQQKPRYYETKTLRTRVP